MIPAVAVIGGLVAASVTLAGCATLSPQEQDQLRAQVGGLQSQVAALNSQVEELRTRQQALEGRAWDQGVRVARSHAVLTGKEIQLALQRAGVYQGPVDGKIGPQTRVAIKLFQTAHQLTADGVAGTKTMQALQAYLTPESPEPSAP